jgi:hypothetical protein
MMIVIPVLSIASAIVTVDWILAYDKYLIPSTMRGIPRPPDFFYNSDGLMTIFKLIAGYENFYAIAVVSIIYIFLISGFISMVYSIVYIRIAPNRYGPLDAPPVKVKIKKKSR